MFSHHRIPHGGGAVALLLALTCLLYACAPQDNRSSEQKLIDAAANGDTESKYLLGHMYCCGYEPGKNEEKALTWWCQAAREGHAEAQFELGRMYQMGDQMPMMSKLRYQSVPVKKDNVVALAWYATSAKHGNRLAKQYESLLYRALGSVERQQAYEMLKDPRSIPCRYRGQTL